MAYTGQVAQRPASIDGCLQSFNMSFIDNTVRTQAENGAFIKVRRRTTSPIRVADCAITLPASKVQDFIDWFQVNCQSGVLPTRIKVPPYGEEQIWRFSGMPTIEWVDPAAATITFKMEKLPLWVD